MSYRNEYLEALKTFDDWVIVSEWERRFGELYPDLLEKTEREANNQANETTGLCEIAAKMQGFTDNLNRLFKESLGLEKKIKKQLAGLRCE